MTILFSISDILNELFPDAEQSPDALITAMKAYYTVNGIEPTVRIVDGVVEVNVSTDEVENRHKEYEQAVASCEAGRFERAREQLQTLVELEPNNSEYHRLLGQVYEQLGDPEKAIDHLIDALRWDPMNTYALTMMGNLQSRHRRDIATAIRYYEAALEVKPDDHLATNNIAGQYMNLGKWDEAEGWFDKAADIRPDYPNTRHGLAIVSEKKGDLPSAFFEATEALRLNKNRDILYGQSLGLAQHLATRLIEMHQGSAIVQAMCAELQEAGGKPVRSIPDPSIATAAKLELAENYGRAAHEVRYKPDQPYVEHLELHELYHLRYILEARAEGLNELFTAGPANRDAFMKAQAKDRSRLIKHGLAPENVDRFLQGLFDGMNLQVFNAPMDLFIEYDMHNEHAEMRPYQFLSIARLVEEGIQATTDKRIIELAPADILSKSKVYNMTLALLYRELYGVDRLADFKANGPEQKQAERLYTEFKEYRDDREPAEEYELLRHWAEDLKLTPYFALVKEDDHRAAQATPPASLDEQLGRIEDDPLDLKSNDPERDREMKTFQEGQAAIGTNMAVVMFMVDALKHFKGKPVSEIKEAATEIAMLGTQGIHPEKQGYKLHKVPGKTFSGYH
ncbi:MAG: tetratricopeptide repeat protein, partial [Flavobacteriales bacterium]